MTWGEGGSRTRLLAGAGLAVLAVLVGVLVVLALGAGDTEAETGVDRGTEIAPPPIETPEPAEPEATPAPQVTPSAALLSVLEGEVTWRTTGGACTPGQPAGAPPVLERSVEAGDWQNVTPANFDIREVAFLSGISESAAEAVVLLGDDCAAQVIRTFTSGEFWEPYDASIRGAIAVAADHATVLTDAGAIPAPCAAPIGNASGQSGTPTAMVCEGALARWGGDSWALSDQPGIVSAAVDPQSGVVVTASVQQPECDGTLLRRWGTAEAPSAESCVPLFGTTALYATPTAVWVWHGAGVEAVGTP